MHNKKIWIMNHYATGMFFNKGGRHHWFAKYLMKKGYEPVVFCANTRHNSVEVVEISNKKFSVDYSDDIPYVFVKTTKYTGNGYQRIKNMFVFYKNLFPVAKEYDKIYGKPDVILTSSVHPLTLLAGIKIAKKFSVPCICEVRDLWPETLVAFGQIKRNGILARLLYVLENFIYKKADKLIFTFPGGKDYVESIGLDNSKVRYINNGVDLEQFNKNKTQYIYNDADLENRDTFKVLYTGAMGQANALLYLIKAAEIIQKGTNKIRFILFGDGYQKKELEDYVKNNNLNNVTFKGKVEKKYIPYILSKSDLNVFTGKYIYLYKYGLSLNKMFEYFASGKPILSNIECGYDLLEQYKCGVTVKGGSPEALADGILKFYNMPKDKYDTYCENAVQAAKEFDFKTLTNKLESVIKEVL